MSPDGPLRLAWRPFAFALARPLETARGRIAARRGWLLRLEDGEGAVGWGEAAPLEIGPAGRSAETLAAAIAALGPTAQRPELERALPQLPAALAFALGAALAELDGLVGPAAGGWFPPPSGAWLLPAGDAVLPALTAVRATAARQRGAAPAPSEAFTVKWKVGRGEDRQERRLLEEVLGCLPEGCRLRLDANGAWDRATATSWAARLAGDPRLEWLEQPLDPADHAGLVALAAGPPAVPVALDESLAADPALRRSWGGWQVRRPSQEGDPRPLLAQLRAGVPRLMLSTGFETGIGGRWLHHLAALQAWGPTPAAPGLAPDWGASGMLASPEPEQVWAAAAAGRVEPSESGRTFPPPR